MADFFPGSIHSVLPAIQSEFTLNIILGGVFLGAFNFASNWVQVFTGQKGGWKMTKATKNSEKRYA